MKKAVTVFLPSPVFCILSLVFCILTFEFILEDIEQGMATILVADDEPINRSLIQRRLERAGYHVLTAQNGQEAVDKTRESLPDLVLLDIMMPVMDGLEACRLIKEDAMTTDIPVIFLSARGETEDM